MVSDRSEVECKKWIGRDTIDYAANYVPFMAHNLMLYLRISPIKIISVTDYLGYSAKCGYKAQDIMTLHHQSICNNQ